MKVPSDFYFYCQKQWQVLRFVLIDVNEFFNPCSRWNPATRPPLAPPRTPADIPSDISTFLSEYRSLFGNPQLLRPRFHTYDFEPGDEHNGNKEKRYVVNYSRISSRLFAALYDVERTFPRDAEILTML